MRYFTQTKIYLIAVFFLIGACAMVPISERNQLRLLPESQLIQLSMNSYQEVLSQSKVVQDSEQLDQLKRVGNRLAAATERYLLNQGQSIDHYDWEFTLIQDDETINAWAMPGGKIAFYTGIMPIAQDENGIAVIMGHEIAHVVANHGNERMSQALLVELGGSALSYAMQNQPEQTQQTYNKVYGISSQVGVMLPYSRLHESEADRIGLILMAMAGYDPRAAIPFWQRMGQAGSGEQPPTLLSSHPHPEQRVSNIQKYSPEALEIYQANR